MCVYVCVYTATCVGVYARDVSWRNSVDIKFKCAIFCVMFGLTYTGMIIIRNANRLSCTLDFSCIWYWSFLFLSGLTSALVQPLCTWLRFFSAGNICDYCCCLLFKNICHYANLSTSGVMPWWHRVSGFSVFLNCIQSFPLHSLSTGLTTTHPRNDQGEHD